MIWPHEKLVDRTKTKFHGSLFIQIKLVILVYSHFSRKKGLGTPKCNNESLASWIQMEKDSKNFGERLKENIDIVC